MASIKDKLKEKHSGLSPLMADREKMETEEVLTYDSLTLDNVHLVRNGDNEIFCIVTFKEAPTKFYFGGKVLTEIVLDIYRLIGETDITEVVAIGDENIGLKVERRNSKNRKTYFNWHII